MATTTLEEFLQDRLRVYDPTIDLSSGSPADAQVVQPTVVRYQPDPFEMPVEEFLDSRMAQEFPDTNVQEGTGLRDLLIKPMQVLLDPVIRELQLIKNGQSLIAPDQLADSEVDAFAANLFVNRNTGDLSRGKGRLYFNAPQAVRVSVGNVFYTADNLRFYPDRQQSISAENMAFNQSGALFYFDVDVVAEQSGDQYNIDVGYLVGVTNISVAVRVTNVTRFTGGLPTETSEDLIARTAASITERSLVTPRGVSARLRDEFPALTQLQVIGCSDPEMNRDVLTGGDLGEVILSGVDGIPLSDGAGGSTTTRLGAQVATVLPPGFSPGPVPAESPLYLLTTEVVCGGEASIEVVHRDRLLVPSPNVFDASDVGRVITILGVPGQNGVKTLKISQVVGGYIQLVDAQTSAAYYGAGEQHIKWVLIRSTRKSQIVSFDGNTTDLVVLDDPANGSYPLPADSLNWVTKLSWEIRRRELTISGVPSGIVLSDERAAIKVLPGQVHIGGCSDFYVRGQAADAASQVIADLEDENPLFRDGVNGRTISDQRDFFWDRPTPDVSDDSYWYGGMPTTVNFGAMGVEPGDSLIVETGPDAGTRTILRVGRSNAVEPLGSTDHGCLQVTPPFSSTQEFLRYKIVKTVTVNLRQPTLRKASGGDGSTAQSSNVFTTAGAVNFQNFGVAAGDRLRIADGVDAGDYSILRVAGTGSKNLELSAPLTTSAVGVGWEVLRVQAGLQFPLVQIRSVDLLDSSNQPTGHQVPYGVPVDIRSSSFSNLGTGVKCVTSHAIVGIIGRVPLEDVAYPLPTEAALYIYKDYSASPADNELPRVVPLGGVMNKDELVDAINSRLPGVASLFPLDGKHRLQLRSDFSWLHVSAAIPTGGSQYFGIDAMDDNRQIINVREPPAFSWLDPATWAETPEGARAALDAELDSVQIQGAGVAKNTYLKHVDTARLYVLDFDEDKKITRFPEPQYDVPVQVGTRSIGTARIYFKDPTSMEVLGGYRPALLNTADRPANCAAVRNFPSDPDVIQETEVKRTHFTATVNGVPLRFIPDPALSRVIIPDPTSKIPNNLRSTPDRAAGTGYGLVSAHSFNAQVVSSRTEELDFVTRRVRAGDQIDITYRPILATADFNLAGVVGKFMDIRLGGGPRKTLLFTDQVVNASSLVNFINEQLGSTIASIDDTGRLLLEADFSIEIPRVYSTDLLRYALWAVPYLGLPNYLGSTDGLSNAAVNAGSYTIKTTGLTRSMGDTMGLLLVPEDQAQITSEWNSQHFQIRRTGSQRTHVTAMQNQVESGLYYMDVQLLSDGAGDLYNIPDGTVLLATGYEADGYHLQVVDPNLSFSTEEDVNMVFSRQLLLNGETDDLGNAATLAGQNVQVNYDYSSLTESVQLFIGAELDRVVTASLLARHLFPSYLYFELVYQGGSSMEVVQADVDAYLAGLGPTDNAQASSIQKLAMRRGATFVQNPLVLVSLDTNASRVLSVVRSSNVISHGRLSTFFPGKVVVTRR